MTGYEYKVVPAPAKGLKAPGVKGAEARFAHTLEHRMNEMAADGWEYLRADILPSEERQGLTSTQTVYRSVLVFRRARAEETADQIVADITEEPIEEIDPPDETAEDSTIEDDAVSDESPVEDEDAEAPEEDKNKKEAET